MPKLTINGTELEVAAGTSVLQACEQLGIEIPRFCYHERLSVPANCRMCLVEMEKAPKPVASCAMPCSDGMVVKTDSELVKKARKGVMEFLLINHPLDCPICDQGGECDLQDQAMAYGFDRSRFAEGKRAVKDKELGPLVKTVMNRCIHCTRCVRFAEEIAGVPQLGMTGRGEGAEIGTYIEATLTTEMSGNLVDVCPVGALTNKPYAYAARQWELRKVETIDVHDAVGCNIRLDLRGNEVLRVLPRLHEDINEEWLNDKSRFACDGLKYQRLDTPYLRVNGKLQPASWADALAVVADKLSHTAPHKIAALAGDMVDAESVLALKMLLQSVGSSNYDCRQDGATYDVRQRAGYIFNSGIAALEQCDALLLIGTNPRHEATLINARIRKRWRTGQLQVALVGEAVDLTYNYLHLGDTPAALMALAKGEGAFAQVLAQAKNPAVIIGAGALARADGLALQALTRQIAERYRMVRDDWHGFNVLQLAAGRVGALDLGFVPQSGGLGTMGIINAAQQGDIEVVYLLAADEIDTQRLGQAFVIYQGHHGDRGAHRADVILPGCAYTEKNATYVNTEGRVQCARQAATAPGDAREDWKIIRVLSASMQKPLPFDNLAQLRRLLQQASPVFASIDQLERAPWLPFGTEGMLDMQPFSLPVRNFYMTDVISRASPTMAQCSEQILPLLHQAAE